MNLRNQKGINMITLSVAIIILVIITSVLVYHSGDSTKIRNLKDLYNDVELLNNKVSAYYVEHGDIPKNAKYQNLEFLNLANFNEINPNNGDDFYVIDLEALDGITLNYGRDYDRAEKDTIISAGFEDIYIINEKSHTIYYPRGIEIQGVNYFTIADGWTKVELDIIPISTAEQLAKVGSGETVTIDGEDYIFSLDGSYLLKNDIDLSSVCYKVDGTTANDKSWMPIGATDDAAFTGVFYGNGHEIRNLYINKREGNLGLFVSNSGVVKDLTVEGSITSTSNYIGGITCYNNGNIVNCTTNINIISRAWIGGIAGRNDNGRISNCFNLGNIEGTLEDTGNGKVGGIVGDNIATIEQCYNKGNIKGKSNGVGGISGNNRKIIKLCINNGTVSSTGSLGTGGIAGVQVTNNDSKIENCFNLNDITGKDRDGGIVGYLIIGKVSNCYSIGNVSGTNNVKSIIGTEENSTEVSNNYYLSSLLTTDSNATPKTEAEMKQQAFVDLLNNGQEDAPWIMDTKGINEGYPVLKWQYEE